MSVRNFILECCCTYTSLLSQIISPSFFNLGGIFLYFLNYDYDIVKEGTKEYTSYKTYEICTKEYFSTL